MKVRGKVRERSRQGQGKVKRRSGQVHGKVKEMFRQGKSKVKEGFEGFRHSIFIPAARARGSTFMGVAHLF